MSKIAIILSILILIFISYDFFNRKRMEVFAYSIKDIHPKIVGPIIYFLIAILNFTLNNKYIFLIAFLIAISSFIDSVKKDIITNKGIYTKDGNFKWKHIIGYEWEEDLNIRKNENYYALYFKTKHDKFIFKVKEEDKNEVDELLENKIGDRYAK